MPVPRDVDDRIEGDDGVEAGGREVEVQEIAPKERRGRRLLAREPDLLFRDVDSDDVETLGEPPRLRPVTAAEVEYARARRELSGDLVGESLPRLALDVRDPLAVT